VLRQKHTTLQHQRRSPKLSTVHLLPTWHLGHTCYMSSIASPINLIIFPKTTSYENRDEHNQTKSSIFWDITPCSSWKVNRRFGGTCRLHLQGRKISTASSVDFERNTRRYIPEDKTFRNHHSENLKAYNIKHFPKLQAIN
jgi:hypothetical protein